MTGWSPQSAGSAPVPAERVHEELDGILSGSEFGGRESMLQDFLERLLDRLDLGHLDGATAAVQWGLYVVLAAVLVWLVVVAIRYRPRARRDASSAAGPSVRERVDALLAEARAARTAGDLRLALRLYLFALVVGLGERGEMRYHDAWTNRELLRRGHPSERARAVLEPLVDELEPKEFGRAPIEPADVARLEALCRDHLHTAPGALPA